MLGTTSRRAIEQLEALTQEFLTTGVVFQPSEATKAERQRAKENFPWVTMRRMLSETAKEQKRPFLVVNTDWEWTNDRAADRVVKYDTLTIPKKDMLAPLYTPLLLLDTRNTQERYRKGTKVKALNISATVVNFTCNEPGWLRNFLVEARKDPKIREALKLPPL